MNFFTAACRIECCESIYHESLTLEQTNSLPQQANFLDLDIEIDTNLITKTKLYNKTDDYNFRMVRYPHITSEIPLRIGLNTHYGECIRMYRNCTEYADFMDRVNQLTRAYIDKGYGRELIIKMITKVLGKNPSLHSYQVR